MVALPVGIVAASSSSMRTAAGPGCACESRNNTENANKIGRLEKRVRNSGHGLHQLPLTHSSHIACVTGGIASLWLHSLASPVVENHRTPTISALPNRGLSEKRSLNSRFRCAVAPWRASSPRRQAR